MIFSAIEHLNGLHGRFQISISHASDDPGWDEFVNAAPGGDHLQSSLWAQVKQELGWRALRVELRRSGELVGGCQLLVRSLPIGKIAYCPRGPLTLEGEPALAASVLDALELMVRREHIHYLKVQPPPRRSDIEPMLLGRGFVQSDMPAAPVATVRIALDPCFDHIMARMRPSTRANIRRAEREGVVVQQIGAAGLPIFGELVAATSRRQGFTPYPLRYYAEMLRRFGDRQRAELLVAECRDEALSGAIIIGYGDTVVYKMSAWSGRGTKLHPNEAMLWGAIQWAHDRGYRFFDLEGILEPVARAILAGEELPEEGRRGTTGYKLGMGGQVMLYPRAYDRSFNPLLVWPTRLLAPRLTRFSYLAHRMVGREG